MVLGDLRLLIFSLLFFFLASSFLPIRDNNRGNSRFKTRANCGPGSVMANLCDTRLSDDSSVCNVVRVVCAALLLDVGEEVDSVIFNICKR